MKLRNTAGIYYFQKKKYLAVDDFVNVDVANIISQEYLQKARDDIDNELNDDQCPLNSKAWYGQPKCEFVMVDCLPKMEALTGLKLYPCYTYMRVYGPGEELHWHQDRPSCEISVTVNLGQSGDFDWPIWYADPDDITVRMPVSLPTCSAMIYRGVEVPHWREKFNPPKADDWQVQLFMHYVNQHGPCAQFAYDRREKLFIEPVGTNLFGNKVQGVSETYKELGVRYEVVNNG